MAAPKFTDILGVDSGVSTTYEVGELDAIVAYYAGAEVLDSIELHTPEPPASSGVEVHEEDPVDTSTYVTVDNQALTFEIYGLTFKLKSHVIDSDGVRYDFIQYMSLKIDMGGECGQWKDVTESLGTNYDVYWPVHNPNSLPLSIDVVTDPSGLWSGYDSIRGELVIDLGVQPVGVHLCKVDIQMPGNPLPSVVRKCYQVTIT